MSTWTRLAEIKSPLLLGLDPIASQLPLKFRENLHSIDDTAKAYEDFCDAIMTGVADLVGGIKIQSAYFEPLGSAGIAVMERLLVRAKELDLWTIMDVKREDIGSSMTAYAQAYLDPRSPLSADAMTVGPYLGAECLDAVSQVAKQHQKIAFVLLQTSNPGAREWQQSVQPSLVQYLQTTNHEQLAENWGHLGVVVGATQPKALQDFREQLPNTWFLTPGVGAQGGSVQDCFSIQKDTQGVLIPLSRSVLYASEKDDFIEAARKVLQSLSA